MGPYPHPGILRKFAREGGRGLLPVQPKDLIPPWGHTGARRARRGRFAPESSWRRRTGGGVPRRARRGAARPGRRGQGALAAVCPGGQSIEGNRPIIPRHKKAVVPNTHTAENHDFISSDQGSRSSTSKSLFRSARSGNMLSTGTMPSRFNRSAIAHKSAVSAR